MLLILIKKKLFEFVDATNMGAVVPIGFTLFSKL
jgi:hypothetical protein